MPTFRLLSRGWALLVVLIFTCIYFLSCIEKKHPTRKIREQAQFQTSSPSISPDAYDRLNVSHRKILDSALAHIRLGYIANRTPYYSTPPLLILYSCKSQKTCSTSFSERLINITNTYYFSMLQKGSAFAYDMTWPVRFEWFFSPLPSYMSMTVDQAAAYLEVADPTSLRSEPYLTKKDLILTDFLDRYRSQAITILNTTRWEGDWMDLKRNPSIQAARDSYRLNHLPQKSDWFWIVSQLLFSQPSDELRSYLLPYQDMMGGKIDRSVSLNRFDPDYGKVTAELKEKGWFRVGVRLSRDVRSGCVRDYVTTLCERQQLLCHVFLSTSDRVLFDQLKEELDQSPLIEVHAVSKGLGFSDLNQPPDSSADRAGIFESEESRLKKDYARVFMDWMILSRMDYLIGQAGDDFIKTAAWAAQVQTDLIQKNGNCQILPMTDW